MMAHSYDVELLSLPGTAAEAEKQAEAESGRPGIR